MSTVRAAAIAVLLSACGSGGGGSPDGSPDGPSGTTDASAADAALPANHCTRNGSDGDPLNNEPNWSRCATEEACILASTADLDADGAPLFTCVTPPRAPALDFGVTSENGWAPYEVAGARCNNGDKARFWFRPARDETGALVPSDDWLVFLKGGGGCQSPGSCAARWITGKSFVSPPMSAAWTPPEKGIFRTADNLFSRVNQVYVHYCTSDTFRGIGPRSPNTGLYHDGHLVVEQVFDALVAGLEYRQAPGGPATDYRVEPSSRLLLAGGSAGSMGVASNLDAVAARLDGPVLGLLDSSWGPGPLPGDAIAAPRDFDVFSDATCAAALGADAPHACAHVVDVAPYLETRYFAYQAARDGKLYPYGGVCVRTVDAAACPSPRVLENGLCYDAVADEPIVTPCDHGDALNPVDPFGLACWDDLGAGQPGHPARENAVHVNSCESALSGAGITDAAGDCGAGTTCWNGHCVREGFRFACQLKADCPLPEDVCVAGICAHEPTWMGATPSCRDDAYTFDEDTVLCTASPGCHAAEDCEAGEVCLDAWSTAAAPSIRMGVRQGFRSSSAEAYFVTDGRRKHTILNTSDDAFFQSFGSMRAEGAAGTVNASVYATILDWLLNGPSASTRLMQDPGGG